MRSDELRRELSDLADEPPVSIEDVRTVMQRGQRRIVRRYVSVGTVALIVVIGLVSFAVRGHSPSDHVVEVRPTVPSTVAPTRPLPPVKPVVSSGTGGIIFTSATVGWICSNPILHTADGGRTWQASPFGQSLADRGTVCASVPGDDLWALEGTTHTSLLLQVQGGSSLTTVAPYASRPEGTAVQIAFADEQHGWVLARATAAIGNSGILYRSTNSGLGFALASRAAPSTGVVFSSATEGWGIGAGADLWHTTNAGSTWSDVRVPFPTPAPAGGIAFETISVGGPLIVAKGRRDEGHGGATVFFDVSSDGGRTWALRDGPPAFLDARAALAVVDADHWRLATPSALWITDDAGATWSERTTPTAETAAIAFPTPDEGWALANQGVFETTDGARTWHAVNTTPQPDWHAGLASVPNECPTQPVTPAPGDNPRAAAVQAARAFVRRTRGWTTERVDRAYKVGQDRGVYSGIFAYNVPKFCGRTVAAASYAVELSNDSITENNSRETALVVAHFADGWRVWGDYR